jgi:hypothetical protein
MHYFPPGGLFVASVFYGFLRKIARMDLGAELVRLRQLLETGELATGARRRDMLDEDDKAISASKITSVPSPATSAQRSAHQIGGAR